ncbi:hypothetical protein GpartN1_g3926.t1 [Galdieria partita]|uniref:Uncharacterized protein n=1 Tax=Galdieria partita TaxID=83374 RepID=A0A9C7PX91_9RHOD|nr:hypothetical protein GpartN1_g3926.t1 [Galdieria partita]
MGGGRYFQKVVASLSSKKESERDRNSEEARTPETVSTSVQTLVEEQTQNEEHSNFISTTPAIAMEMSSDPALQTVRKKSVEYLSANPHNNVQISPEQKSKVLPKKRSRRPPVPLGEVKYPTREVLKYKVVIVGIKGTICKQDVDEHSNSEVLFEDVRLAWNAWKAVGVQVALVTNSISFVQAKNILGEELFSLILQYFDEETIGPLDLPDTYIAMAKKLQTSPSKILFAGSVYEHVAAASEAGLQVAIVVRYDNPPLPRDVRYKMCSKLTHLIPASLLIDKGGYVSSEGSTTSC